MARFLSTEWFQEVARHSQGAAADGDDRGAARSPAGSDAPLLLEQVVTGTPDGNVRYRVEVGDGSARIVASGSAGTPPDLTVTTDWETAVAIAQGSLATQSALMEGRLRIQGNLARLADRSKDLAGLDPVPEEVRRETTYES